MIFSSSMEEISWQNGRRRIVFSFLRVLYPNTSRILEDITLARRFISGTNYLTFLTISRIKKGASAYDNRLLAFGLHPALLSSSISFSTWSTSAWAPNCWNPVMATS